MLRMEAHLLFMTSLLVSQLTDVSARQRHSNGRRSIADSFFQQQDLRRLLSPAALAVDDLQEQDEHQNRQSTQVLKERASKPKKASSSLYLYRDLASETWDTANWGVDPPDYLEGPCMNTVYTHFNTGGDVTCTAKEVYSLNATVTGGPPTCSLNFIIGVNVTSAIHFNTGRLDPAIWVSSDPTCTAGQDCGAFGAQCAVGVLGADDKARNGNTPNLGQFDADKAGNVDKCFDVVTPGGGWDLPVYEFLRDMKIPCNE